jgi:hypothetical protein
MITDEYAGLSDVSEEQCVASVFHDEELGEELTLSCLNFQKFLFHMSNFEFLSPSHVDCRWLLISSAAFDAYLIAFILPADLSSCLAGHLALTPILLFLMYVPWLILHPSECLCLWFKSIAT